MTDNTSEQNGFWASVRKRMMAWTRFQKALAISIPGLYLYFSLIGLIYVNTFYDAFGIDIMSFSDPSDFLLVAFSKMEFLLSALWATIIIVFYFVFIIFMIALTLHYLLLVASIVIIVPIGIFIVFPLFTVLPVVIHIILFCGECVWITLKRLIHQERENSDESWMSLIRKKWESRKEGIKKRWDFFIDCYERVKIIHEICAEWVNGHRSEINGGAILISPLLFIILSLLMPHSLACQDARSISEADSSAACDMTQIINIIGRLPWNFTSDEEPSDRQRVQIAIRQIASQPTDRLASCTIFLGSTNSFLFFYDNNQPGKSGSFYVPTANLAYLEFFSSLSHCQENSRLDNFPK